MSESESERWDKKRCSSCGDEFRERKGGRSGYYTCFACGAKGSIETVERDVEPPAGFADNQDGN